MEALREHGIDWTGQKPKSIDEVSGRPWDLVVTVCGNANEACPFLPGQLARVHWGLDDPHELADFQAVARTLRERMERLVSLPPETLQAERLQASAQQIADESP